MSLVKIGPKHQITIPKKVFESLHLEVGDFLEIIVREGKGVFTPKQITQKAPVPKLIEKEQKLLQTAKTKIERIQSDLQNSTGLSAEEIEVAVKVGLIDAEQKWWWTEEWQKGEREAENDRREGRLSKPTNNADDFFDSLDSAIA